MVLPHFKVSPSFHTTEPYYFTKAVINIVFALVHALFLVVRKLLSPSELISGTGIGMMLVVSQNLPVEYCM